MSKPGTASFEHVDCVNATDKALKVIIEGEEFWCPKSVVDDDSEVYDTGHSGTLIVQEWWAKSEELL